MRAWCRLRCCAGRPPWVPLHPQYLGTVCAQDRRDAWAACYSMLRALSRGCGRLIVVSGTSWRVVEGAKRRQEGGTGVSKGDGGFNHLYFSATCRYSSTVSFTRFLGPVAGPSRRRAPRGQPGAPPLLPSGGAPVISGPVKINYFLAIYS